MRTHKTGKRSFGAFFRFISAKCSIFIIRSCIENGPRLHRDWTDEVLENKMFHIFGQKFLFYPKILVYSKYLLYLRPPPPEGPLRKYSRTIVRIASIYSLKDK